MDGFEDPDIFALILVQQFLAERGWDKALHEVELAAGIKYYDGRAPRGSMLLEVGAGPGLDKQKHHCGM